MSEPHTADVSTGMIYAQSYETRAINVERRSADFICSTASIDSHDEIVAQNWRLERYARNPVVLWAHDTRSMPIGRAENVRIENGALVATIVFAEADVCAKAEDCWKAVRAGLVKGCSVGFKPHSYRWELMNDREVLVLDDNELFELSVVPVPANAESLRKSTGETINLIRDKAKADREKGKKRMEDQIKALRDDVAAKTAEIERINKDVAAEKAAREVAEKAARESAEKAALIEAECSRLRIALDAESAARREADDKLLRLEVEALVGKSLDPAEVDHFIALKKSAPALFDAEVRRRQKSGDHNVAAQAIPDETPGDRAPATGSAFDKALTTSPSGGR